MSNVFDAYKMPLGLTEGVEIPLKGTPAVFKVVLPASTNEDFHMSLMSSLNATPDEEGEVRIDGVEFQRKRKKLFFDTCILEANGLPNDMGVDEFFAEYPMAKLVLFKSAMELAGIADEEVTEAMEKLEPTLNGKHSGVGAQSSMTPSLKKASNPKQHAPN